MTQNAQLEAQFQPVPELTQEDHSKDQFYVRLALVVDDMLKAHGKDFAMGALILAARFMAEGKPLIKRVSEQGAQPS